jgi:two-component system NarL family sensor kinase
MQLDNVTILIIVGSAGMLLLALVVVFFVVQYQKKTIRHQMELKAINERQQYELTRASIHSEEEERLRIASELHDDVASTLASVKVYLYSASFEADNREILNLSKELLNDGINKVRDISHKLQPVTLQHLGLEKALQSLILIYSRSGKMTTYVKAYGDIPRQTEEKELTLYRISQELINNTIKHALPSQLTLEMRMPAGMLELKFMHNGRGIDQEEFDQFVYKDEAFGLKNIVNRLKFINGAIKFEKFNDEKYSITVSSPLIPLNIKTQN